MRIDNYKNSYAAAAFLESNRKFGSNAGVATSWENIWELAANYTFLSTAGTLYMASTDNTNDLDLEITIEALDANWLPITLVVNLDGTGSQTPVLVSATTVMRVNRAYVSDPTAITGNVYIAREDAGTWVTGIPGTLTNTLAYVPASDQITLQCVYSTQGEDTEKLWEWESTTASAQATNVRIQIRYDGGTFITISKGVINNSQIIKRWTFPWDLPPKTDVIVQAQAQAATSDVTAEFTTSKVE